ncbi:MAG: DUF721 domain-containing protein [Planctomycetia bacterium]|nr:DUF721 domain-containing protein [Planctomycetia bacterium]
MLEEMPERYFYNRRKVLSIGQLLKEVFPKGHGADKTCHKVNEAWRSVVGEEVCQCTEITGLKKGVLYVTVESAPLIHHLTNFEKDAIISGINELMSTQYVQDIRFKAGMVNNGRRK